MRSHELDPADQPTARSRSIVRKAYADRTQIRRPQTPAKRSDLRRAAMEWQREHLERIVGDHHGAQTEFVERVCAHRPELGLTFERLNASLRKHRLLTMEEAVAIAHVREIDPAPLTAHLNHMPWLAHEAGDISQALVLATAPSRGKRTPKPAARRTRRVLSVDVDREGIHTIRMKARISEDRFTSLREVLATTEHSIKARRMNGAHLVEVTSTTDADGAASIISAIYMPQKRTMFGSRK